MAYMRGNQYLWDDESGLHIWVADGYDGWNESLWHCEETDDTEDTVIRASHIKNGAVTASGVSIRQEIMDEYVVMRLAELLDAGKLDDAIDRSVAKWQRASLAKHATAIKAALSNRDRG